MANNKQEPTKITKETLIPLGLVIAGLTIAYNYGAISDSVRANANDIDEIKASYKVELQGIHRDMGGMKTSLGRIEGFIKAMGERKIERAIKEE